MNFANIFHWVFIILLWLIGLSLTLLGGFLVYLGGSPYYFVAGIVTIVVAVLVKRRNPKASKVYAGILLATLVWALFEAELDFLTLLPRLAAWLGLGLWFLTPWYHKSLVKAGEAKISPANRWWIGGSSLAAVAVLILASFQGYTQNSTGTDRKMAAADGSTDWRNYGNDEGGTRFAQISDINADTVGNLKEVWRYRTGVEEDFQSHAAQCERHAVYLCGAQYCYRD